VSRLVLAFDTATEACALALGTWTDGPDAPRVIATGDIVAHRAALSRLLPAVMELLEEAGITVADLGLVVVGRGPGSYTGVRIGMATAKGLTHGLGVPLGGVGTLDAVAWGLTDHQGLLGVVADAMRQEVYTALFECSGGHVRRLEDDIVHSPEDAAGRWAEHVEGDLLLAGDGLAKHGEVFFDVLGGRVSSAPQERWLPTGAGLLAAAWAAGERALDDPAVVLPIYTSLSDAEHKESGRTGRVPESGVAGPPPSAGGA
jgi:N6-L-threonylcarbamoyladenine synthase/protein kinase Bud32